MNYLFYLINAASDESEDSGGDEDENEGIYNSNGQGEKQHRSNQI